MIRIENIRFAYKKQPVFKDFSLHIKPGESILITGINGIGKTTLLRLMAGVLLPQKGIILYSDKMGSDPRSKIGFISDKMNLYEHMSLQEAIRYHCSVYDIKSIDMEMMENARLRSEQKIVELSRGQKLVFHLSLILAARPEILLIDEVIHSMDVYLRDLFLNRLLEMIEKNRVTLVLVNLNFHDIEKIPQRILLLKDNQIAVDEPIDSLKARVKKLITDHEISGLPVLLHREYQDGHEYFIYPFKEELGIKTPGKLVDLNLHDIIKAFIGGEYA
ncbi:MAG: ATP-binding cassette domain-containing protein [Candidatus Aminicenantes bacterium]|nr:ATP-binding cassette domain-containing protein [Candidatus Aminicenantes bacterium]